MADNAAIVARYLDVLAGVEDRYGRPVSHYAGTRIYAEGRTIYSYGRHFPLCEYFPAGGARRRALFLLNGDRWSGGWGTTARHQAEVREQVSARADDFNAEVLIVPYSALDAARIRHETIVPLEIRADRTLEHVEPVPAYLDLDDLSGAPFQDFDHGPHSAAGRVWKWTDRDGRDYSRTLYRRAACYPSAPPYAVEWRESDDFPAAPVSEHGYRDGSHTLTRGAEGWYATVREHLLGDSLFSAVAVENTVRRRPVTVADVVSTAWFACRVGRDAIADLDELGEEIAETVPSRRRRKYLSSFDTNEPAPLYFLATLPRTPARTVDAALDALAPPAVHAAYARGREVFRQGDIFCVATDLDDSAIQDLTRRRARLTQWTRNARARKGEIGFVAPLLAADRRRVSALTARYFRDELRGAVARALETGAALPRSGRGARRKRGAEIARRAAIAETHRQNGRGAILRGDVRAARNARSHAAVYGPVARTVPNHRDDYRGLYGANARNAYQRAHRRALERVREGLVADGATWTRNRELVRATLAVHGTAHAATEVVQAIGGAVYVRGVMRHTPSLEQGRGGEIDHRPLPLGDRTRWYLAIRNTVPRQ